jgi:RimJ/RimL family protein N-acetyltransferase
LSAFIAHTCKKNSVNPMNNPLIILETERLRLRHLHLADIPALVDLWHDPGVTHYMGGPRDRARLKAIFAEVAKTPLADQYDLWPVEEKQTGKIVGHCGLLDKEVEGKTEIELVYVFAQPVWGKGYATEMAKALKEYAFEQMGIRRLVAIIEPENIGSEKVAVKVGMQLEKEIVRPNEAVRRMYMIET